MSEMGACECCGQPACIEDRFGHVVCLMCAGIMPSTDAIICTDDNPHCPRNKTKPTNERTRLP